MARATLTYFYELNMSIYIYIYKHRLFTYCTCLFVPPKNPINLTCISIKKQEDVVCFSVRKYSSLLHLVLQNFHLFQEAMTYRNKNHSIKCYSVQNQIFNISLNTFAGLPYKLIRLL